MLNKPGAVRRLAGVRLGGNGSPVLLVVAGEEVTAGDVVEVEIDGTMSRGRVVVRPEDVVQSDRDGAGRITRRIESGAQPTTSDEALAAIHAHLSQPYPRLGERVEVTAGDGTVVNLDIPGGTFRIRLDDGEEVDISV